MNVQHESWVEDLVTLVFCQIPKVLSTTDPPGMDDGHWHVDFKYDDKFVNVEFRPKEGWGVSLITEDTGYGQGADDIFENMSRAAAQVVELLTGKLKPYEVCLKDGKKVIGYACSKCHMFCSPLIYACGWDNGIKAAHDHAVTCCADRMCNECNVNMGPPEKNKVHWLLCQPCRSKKDNEKESKLYQEAKKIPLSEYKDTMLYYMDEYYDDEVITDKYSFDEPPKYAWACDPHDFSLDASDIVSSGLEHGEHHEDAYDDISDKDIKRLQRFLDAWCKHVGVRSWFPNFNLAVLIPPPDEEQT